MKKLLPFFALCILFYSCQEAASSVGNNYEAKETIEGTLKEVFRYDLNNDRSPTFLAKDRFMRNHKDEILKTLEVVEKVEIPKKDLTLVFYRYSIGADFGRYTAYFKELNGKWYVHAEYFTSYSEDPFNNGEGAKGKELLERVEEWGESEGQPWWH